jgi:threonine dehydratase
VFLKGKHLQPTGSFKLRGVSNKLRLLERAERAAGVVTASTGNHGLAAARAGSLLGVSVMVYVAASASPLKIAAIRAFGAELVLVEGPTIAAERQAVRVLLRKMPCSGWDGRRLIKRQRGEVERGYPRD